MLIIAGPHSTHSKSSGRQNQFRSPSVSAQHCCLHEAASSSSRWYISHGDEALQHVGAVCVSLSVENAGLTSTAPSHLSTVSTTSRPRLSHSQRAKYIRIALSSLHPRTSEACSGAALSKPSKPYSTALWRRMSSKKCCSL
jgi:hypothetical protein